MLLTVYIFKEKTEFILCVYFLLIQILLRKKKILSVLGSLFQNNQNPFPGIKMWGVIKGRDFQRMSWQKIEVVIKITHSST